MHRVTIALCLALTAGCYSPHYQTQALPTEQLHAVAGSSRGRPMVLRDRAGHRVRLGPQTLVRFEKTDGQLTPTYKASQLRLGQKGVVVGSAGLAWNDIAAVHLSNVDGGDSLGLTAGATVVNGGIVVVTACVMLVAALATGGAGASLGELPIGYYEPDSDRPKGGKAPLDATLSADDTTPLFTRGARVRAWAEPLVRSEVGLGLDGGFAGSTLSVGVRLAEVVELSGGVRFLEVDPHDGAGPVGGFGRASLVFDLDPAARWSLVWGLEAGGQAGRGLFAMPFGLRYRLTDQLVLGVEPVNPTYVAGAWTYPSSLELTWQW